MIRLLRTLGEGLEAKHRKHRWILNPVSLVRACLLGDDRMVATLIRLWADIANTGFDHEYTCRRIRQELANKKEAVPRDCCRKTPGRKGGRTKRNKKTTSTTLNRTKKLSDTDLLPPALLKPKNRRDDPRPVYATTLDVVLVGIYATRKLGHAPCPNANITRIVRALLDAGATLVGPSIKVDRLKMRGTDSVLLAAGCYNMAALKAIVSHKAFKEYTKKGLGVEGFLKALRDGNERCDGCNGRKGKGGCEARMESWKIVKVRERKRTAG